MNSRNTILVPILMISGMLMGCSQVRFEGSAALNSSLALSPSNPVTDPPPGLACTAQPMSCDEMRVSIANGAAPAVATDGLVASGAVALNGPNLCQATEVTSINSWGSPVVIIASQIDALSAMAAPQVYLNAGSVGSIANSGVTGDIAVVTHAFGNFSATGPGELCLSAQNVGRIEATGSPISLYSRNEGGERGTLQAITAQGTSAVYIDGYEIIEPIYGLGSGSITLKNDVAPSISAIGGGDLSLIGATITGDVANLSTGAFTMTNSNIGGALSNIQFTTLTAVNSHIHQVGGGAHGAIVLDGSTVDVYRNDSPDLTVTCRNGGKVLSDQSGVGHSNLPANCLSN